MTRQEKIDYLVKRLLEMKPGPMYSIIVPEEIKEMDDEEIDYLMEGFKTINGGKAA